MRSERHREGRKYETNFCCAHRSGAALCPDGLRQDGGQELTCNGSGNTALDCNGTYTNNGGDVTTNDGSENNPGQMGGGKGGAQSGGGRQSGTSGGGRPDGQTVPSNA